MKVSLLICYLQNNGMDFDYIWYWYVLKVAGKFSLGTHHQNIITALIYIYYIYIYIYIRS
jgi:hypothetical protein